MNEKQKRIKFGILIATICNGHNQHDWVKDE